MKAKKNDLDSMFFVRHRRRVPLRACVKRPVKTKAQYIKESREAEKIILTGFDCNEIF